jgi:tRNA(Arg) A34 adenosine deaminase TadA
MGARFSTTDIRFELDLPAWALGALNDLPTHLPTVPARMAAVIEFVRRNVREDTGGPFASGIFERDSGRLVVIGVNRVVENRCSSAHAEVMAFSLAQRILGTWDLGAPGLPAHQMVNNWRPCAMCLGATAWSGVRSLVVAGDGPELEAITGVDEGPAHPDWRRELERRGIDVIQDVLRDEALAAFHEFAASRSEVYNARQGSRP